MKIIKKLALRSIILILLFHSCDLFTTSIEQNDTFTIIYDGNGYTNGIIPIDNRDYLQSEEVLIPNNDSFSRNNYRFMGWNTKASGFGISYQPNEKLNIKSDLILYARWEIYLSVIYHANNNTSGTIPFDNSQYLYGKPVHISDKGSLSRDNYSFTGWNTSADGTGVHYKPNTIINIGESDLNLYAQWEVINQYVVNYNGNNHDGGYVPVDNSSYITGESIILADPGSLSRQNYFFSGWNTQSNSLGVSYSSGAVISVVDSDITLYAIWTQKPTYHLSYNGNEYNDGDIPVDNMNYLSGSYATVKDPGNISRNYFDFDHWNTSSDGSGVSYFFKDEIKIINQNITLFATWVPVFTITYKIDSADSGSITFNDNEYRTGDTVTLANKNDLSKAGYNFIGWSDMSDGSGTIYNESDNFSIPEYNVSLYPVWTALPTYTLTIISDNTVIQENNYLENSVVIIDEEITKNGFTFIGWSLNSDGSGRVLIYNETITLDEDIILYAMWEEIPTYNVEYISNEQTSGEAYSDLNNYYSNDVVTIAGYSTLSRDGYQLIGWSINEDLSGYIYTPGDEITINNSDISLYIIWDEIPSYNLLYNGTTYTSGIMPISIYGIYAGDYITIPDQLLNKENFTFTEWNTEMDGFGDSYTTGNIVTIVNSHITLYAIWEELPKYDLTFNGNTYTSGTLPTTQYDIYQGKNIIIPSEISIVKDGYIFKGWNTDINGSEGSFYYPGFSLTINNEDIILYAIWEEIPVYSISFNGNSNTSGYGPLTLNGYENGSTITAPGKYMLEKYSYIFDGWNTKDDGTGTTYNTGDTITVQDQDITLYAKWDALPRYSLLYSGNYNTSGLSPNPSLNNLAGTIVTIEGINTLIKDHYTFKGWSTNTNGTGEIYSPGVTYIMSNENVTFYAVWELDPTYSITYHGNTNTNGVIPTDATQYFTGQTISLESYNTLTKTDFAIKYWNSKADGTGITYSVGDELVMVSSNINLYAIWEPVFTVTYFGNSNTKGINPIDNNLYISGSSVVFSDQETLLRDGYRFIGWNTLTSGSGISYQTNSTLTEINENIVLYAKWAETFNITYHNDNDTVESAPLDNYNYISNEHIITLGYSNIGSSNDQFLGWGTYDGDTSINYNVGYVIPVVSHNFNLYAIWEKKYTVSYHSNGATGGVNPFDSSLYSYSDRATLSDSGTLEKDDYTFYAWSKSADTFSTRYYPGYDLYITENVDLYPWWQPNLSIHYNGNGNTDGEVPVDNNIYIDNNSVITLPHGNLENLGYYQDGWNTKADGTGSNYDAGRTIYFDEVDIILYAKWLPKIKVSYYSNNGNIENTPVFTDYVLPGESISIISGDKVNYGGYTFNKWRKNNNSTYYTEGDTYSSYSYDLVLYAQWRENLNITYDGNGHTGGVVPADNKDYLEIIDEDAIILDPGTLTKDGYWFEEWAEDPYRPYDPGEIVALDQDITLYAQWEENYVVTYYGVYNTAGSVPVDSMTYAQNATVTILNQGDLIKEHYDFKGWSTYWSGSLAYDSGDTFSIIEEESLFAVWEENPKYTIIYISNDQDSGVPNSDSTQYYSGDKITLSDQCTMRKDNYDFMGWKTNELSSTADFSSAGEITVANQNITLYAHWQERPKLVYYGNGNTGGASEVVDYNDLDTSITIENIEVSSIFTNINHVLKEWNTNADGTGTSYAINDTLLLDERVKELYAIWTPGTDGLEYTLDFLETYYKVDGHDGVILDIVIPEMYQGIPVTAIQPNGLDKNITSIIIPESFTTISPNLFSGYDKLSSVTLPDSVTTIENYAFYGCTALTEIDLRSVEQIDGYAFYNCDGLTSIDIPSSVRIIGNYVFTNSNNLSEIILNNGLESIGADSFKGCDLLTAIEIPGSVDSIGEQAFYDLTNLATITLNEGLKTIGEQAFYNSGLTTVTIPGTVTSIGSGAFRNCSNLNSVTITEGVTSLGIETFRNSNIISVIIPSTVVNINNSSFLDCINLTYITFNEGLESIGTGAFYNTNIETLVLPNSVIDINNKAFEMCSNLSSVTLSNTLESIGDKAFKDTPALLGITIPAGVTSIGSEAFSSSMMQTVVMEGLIPPSMVGEMFKFVPHYALTIYVPDSVESTYESTSGWSHYKSDIKPVSEL